MPAVSTVPAAPAVPAAALPDDSVQNLMHTMTQKPNLIDIVDEIIEDSDNTSNIYTVASPGYYQVNAKASLNREDKNASSNICTVTFEPKIPTMSYNEETQKLIQEGSNMP